MKALFPHPSSTLLPSHPFPWRPVFYFPSSSPFRFSFTLHYRPPDSNAETFTSHNFRRRYEHSEVDDQDDDDDQQGFDPGIRFRTTTRKNRRRWWSDEPAPDFEDQPSGILDDVIDSVWIFKVFKSYGWTLPPIIFSLLLNSGPKAFLMALALPLGQSIISLALEKLWGTPERKPKRRTRSKTRKRPFYSTGTSRVQEEEEEARGNGEGNGKMGYGYQSWEVGSNGGEVRKEGRNGTSFGGWEDLDGVGSERKAKPGVRGKKQSSTSMEKGKLSWREKKSDTPLLLRLLIAVFPFLGSWTRML
ncbi:uncharacterized protein LOC120092944 [Benincasa hispida]|uniref:uncharacterized protein LOC120092944 n=1 Tax=Benincasa hispida TaxID=102211 RepID=UPI001900E05A|nr:uncharacterized protein LOC120092944 [Benincasa hispida]